jgi:hypothetical protein
VAPAINNLQHTSRGPVTVGETSSDQGPCIAVVKLGGYNDTHVKNSMARILHCLIEEYHLVVSAFRVDVGRRPCIGLDAEPNSARFWLKDQVR